MVSSGQRTLLLAPLLSASFLIFAGCTTGNVDTTEFPDGSSPDGDAPDGNTQDEGFPNDGSPDGTDSPASSVPIGSFDLIDASGVAAGWALVPSLAPASIPVEFYVDGPEGTGRLLATILSDIPRPDVNQALGIPGDHGFTYSLPLSVRDGLQHSLWPYGVGPSSKTSLGSKDFTLGTTGVDPASFSLAQIRDLQGDLMLWVPSLAPSYVNGIDPVTGMKQVASDGGVPLGIQAGWIWTLMIDRYPQDKRELIYQAALDAGYTHFAIQVTQCTPGDGYHGLFPVTAADCQGYDVRLNALLHELWDHHLIPICTGVSPTDPVAPGLDKSLCRIVLDDWDNSDQADCRIKALADTFPDAQIVYELPTAAYTPAPDSCSSVPFPATGPEWLAGVQQNYPNFFAVAYETNQPDGFNANAKQIARSHPWWRDLQEVRFETDAYWKFWYNLDPQVGKNYNDALEARVPWLRGFMSGGTTHPPPTGGLPPQNGLLAELDLHLASLEHMAPDFGDWPITTNITRVEVRLSGVHVELDGGHPDCWPDTPDRPGMGPLLYSLGMAELIDGVWHASAPIQLWRGLTESGGPIESQDIGDGTGRGQIQANWFYDSRWGAMGGYQPVPGEVIGMFVCAGDCRDGVGDYSPVHERSNVVLFSLPNSAEEAVLQW